MAELEKAPPRLRNIDWKKVDQAFDIENMRIFFGKSLPELKEAATYVSCKKLRRELNDKIDLIENWYIPQMAKIDPQYNRDLVHEYLAYYRSKQQTEETDRG